MSILDFFKKKKCPPPQAEKNTNRYRSFDRIDVHYTQAMEPYCALRSKTEEDLSDEETDDIWRMAGNHIGFFLTWLFCHHYEGSLHDDEPQAVEQVRTGQLLGVDFLMQYCDGKFWGEDFSDDIFPFVDAYYDDHYWTDYANWVVNELHDLPYEFIGTWEDYQTFAPMLEKAYKKFS